MVRQKEMLRFSDIPLEAGVSKTTVYAWRNYADFPQPREVRGKEAIYLREEVDAFLRRHNLGLRYEDTRPGNRRGAPRSERNTEIALAFEAGRQAVPRGVSPWLMLPAGAAGVIIGWLACALS